MRSFYTVSLLLSFSAIPFLLLAQESEPIRVNASSRSINLVAANVCSYYSVLTLNDGIDSTGYLPTLGYGCFPQMGPFNYAHVDSLRPQSEKIVGMDLVPNGTPSFQDKFFYAGRDSSIIAFKVKYPTQIPCQPVIAPHDTVFMDSIVGISAHSINMLSVIRSVTAPQPNLVVYNDSLSTILFSTNLNIKPVLVAGDDAYCCVIGEDTIGRTVLNIIDLNTLLIIKDTLLGSITAKPYKLTVEGWTILLASEPGDSCISIFKYNYLSGVSSSSIIYYQSGIHAGDWEAYSFHYQPETDTSISNADLSILVYNALNMTAVSTNPLNKRFSLIDYPGEGWGFFPYMFCTEEDSATANLRTFIYYTNYIFLDSILTGQNPAYFIGDFRCDIGIDEYDDEKVSFKAYPNPSSGEINLTASGLIC